MVEPTAVVSAAELLATGQTPLGRVQPYEAHIGYLMQFKVSVWVGLEGRGGGDGLRGMVRGGGEARKD
jgi:hypothetical protein